jgi:hypothetical protein
MRKKKHLHLLCQLVHGFQLMEFVLMCTLNVVYVSVHGQDLSGSPGRSHCLAEVYLDKSTFALLVSKKDKHMKWQLKLVLCS